MKILIVKVSSMGDIIHNLPIVWDLRSKYPEAQIDWVVEDGYMHLLQPLKTSNRFRGIDNIICLGLRRWKKNILKVDSWREFLFFLKKFRVHKYDFVVDTQGLIKTAILCFLSRKKINTKVLGLANSTEYSGYEGVSRFFYTESVKVPFRCHAVVRSRYLANKILGFDDLSLFKLPEFFPRSFIDNIPVNHRNGFQKNYVLMIHSTARNSKRWPQKNWVALGQKLSLEGYQIVLPWGSDEEMQMSKIIASEISNSFVPEHFSLQEAFSIIFNSRLVVGVDTGLTHLAASLNKKTIEIYCDSPRWKTEGFWSGEIKNIGDLNSPPSFEEVWDLCRRLLNINLSIKN